MQVALEERRVAAIKTEGQGVREVRASRGAFSLRKVVWLLCTQDSDLLMSLTVTALDTCVLAAKLFSAVPQTVGYGAKVLLSYIGEISFTAQIRLLLKTVSDLKDVIVERRGVGVVVVAFKVAEVASTLLLSAGTTLASMAAFMGRMELVGVLYSVLRPWGVALTLVSVALEGYQYYANRHLLRELSDLSVKPMSDERSLFLLKSLREPQRACTDPRYHPLRSKIVQQLDREAWRVLQEALQKGLGTWEAPLNEEQRLKVRELVAVLKENSRKKTTLAESSVALTALGYLSMGLCRAYPDTLLQASLLWSLSVLFTSKLLYRKGWEHRFCDAVESTLYRT